MTEEDKQNFLILKARYEYMGWLPKEDWDWIMQIMQKLSETINVS